MTDQPDPSTAAPDLAHLFEQASTPMLALSPRLHLTAANRAARDLLALPPDWRGASLQRLFPQEAALRAALEQVAATGQTDVVDVSMASGAAQRATVSAVADRDGRLAQLMLHFEAQGAPSVRARRLHGVAALRESAAKFRAIADALPQMVWSTLPDGFHDYYNAQWYIFTGVPRGSTDGDGWNGIFHPDDQERSRAAWQASLASGKTYEIQYRLRHHSGAYRWVLGRALPVRDDAGTIIRWMGTCTDIHDQQRRPAADARPQRSRTGQKIGRDHPAPGAPSHRPGGRSAGRVAGHAGAGGDREVRTGFEGRDPQRGGTGAAPDRSAPAPPAGQPEHRPHRRPGRQDAAGAGGGEPVEQRRQIHRPGRPDHGVAGGG